MSGGHLMIICGPMCSGKTQELIHQASVLTQGLQTKCIAVNSVLDTRDERSIWSTHRKGSSVSEQLEGVECRKVKKLSDLKFDGEPVIIIDEVQFFSSRDSIPTILRWRTAEKRIVIVSGLPTNWKGQPFSGENCTDIARLIPYADETLHLKAVCCECKETKMASFKEVTNAIFTAKISGDMDKEVEIEGQAKYAPMCTNHFFEHLKKTKYEAYCALVAQNSMSS